MLADYIAAGMRRCKTVLAFDRAVETRISSTLPHHLGAVLQRHPLQCPVAFVAGTWSAEIGQGVLAAAWRLAIGDWRSAIGRRLAGERPVWLEGSHLYPMEKPVATAETVLALLASMRPG